MTEEANKNNEQIISELKNKLERSEKIISALTKRAEKNAFLGDSDFAYFETNAILNSLLEEIQNKIQKITKELDEKSYELHKLEEELQKKENQLNEIISSIDDVVWSISYPNISLLFVNKTIEKVFGIHYDKIAETPNLWFGLILPEDRSTFYDAISQLQEFQQVEVEYRIQTIDGQIRYIHDKLTRKIDSDGKIYQIDGIARDITELKLAQINTEITKQQYELIFESAVEGIIILDMNRSVVAINSSACRLFGVRKFEIIGRSADILLSQNLLNELYYNYKTNDLNKDFVTQSQEKRKNGDDFIIEVLSKRFSLNDENFIICSFTDITKRKQAEDDLLIQKNKLVQSEYKLKAILTSTKQSFVLIDKNYTLLSYNKNFEQDVKKFFGQEVSEGIKIYEILPTSLKDTFFDNFNKALGGVKISIEIDIPTIEGQIESFIFNFEPINEETGLINSVVISSKNITKLKEKERKLIEQNAFIQSLLTSIPIPVFYKDKDGRYLGCNEAFERFIKLKSEEMIGKTVFELFDYDKAKVYYEKDKELFENPGTQTYEFEIKTKSGESKYVIFHKATFKNPFNNQIDGIIGTILDITERKQIEKRLIKNQSELEGIYNSTPILICLLDKRLNIRTANNSFIQYTGWPDKNKINKVGNLLNCINAVKAPYGCTSGINCNICELRLAIIETLKTGKPIANIEHKAYVIENNQIKEKFFLVSTSRITNDSENNVIISLLDITERKELEQEQQKLYNELKVSRDLLEANLEQKNSLIMQLEQTQKHLIQLNAEKDKFFSIIAHDLKNPFALLKNQAEELKNNLDYLNFEDIKTAVDDIYETTHTISKLLQNLLDWSRVKLGKLNLNKTEFDFFEIVYNTIYILGKLADAKKIAIFNKIEPNTIINADQYMISTVVRNLISNAIKYTNEGGTISVYANYFQVGDIKYLKVTIEDTGVGIEPSKLNELFSIESKTTTPGTHNETGTGLGLILCKEFIEKHGGIIWAESTVGEGSRFYFSIPV